MLYLCHRFKELIELEDVSSPPSIGKRSVLLTDCCENFLCLIHPIRSIGNHLSCKRNTIDRHATLCLLTILPMANCQDVLSFPLTK